MWLSLNLRWSRPVLSKVRLLLNRNGSTSCILKVRLPPFYLGSSQSSRDDGYRARSHAPVEDIVRFAAEVPEDVVVESDAQVNAPADALIVFAEIPMRC